VSVSSIQTPSSSATAPTSSTARACAVGRGRTSLSNMCDTLGARHY
jgi:hypothetical protein